MERLGSLDAVFLAIEDPASPMSIGSVGLFEGPAPPFESVQAFIGARLQLVPRCRQRVREAPRRVTRPVWIDDVGFDLDDHLHHASLPPERPLALEQLVEEVMARPLRRDRALWEMWVVGGLDHDRWAIVSKVHHCMVDGIAGTDLLAAMMDRAPDVERPPPDAWAPAREPSRIELARFSAAAAARSAWAHTRHFLRMLFHVRTTWNRLRDVVTGARGLWFQPSRRDSPLTGPIGPRRRWARTRVSLADAAAIRHAFGGTVNDVVLAAIAQGFRELLRARGETLGGRTVMALVPVSMRAPDEHGRLDNRVAVTHALLPVGIDDPLATYTAVRRHLDALKVSHETDASTVLLHTGDFTPHAIAAVVARAVVRAQQNLETIATNVPGPQLPLYLCGRRMLEAYPFAPIAGRIRIAIAIWSYCGTLHLGVTGDRDGASDLDPLVLGLDRGLASLLDAAAGAAS
ncbi:MAG: wax ester/triacylglycerol synthase family O-acyltransferase [Acidimicrobiales bacterium]|nr:wax ester/triacylglycerol synthase family O-acyltransferase [Acidimicrobiales bacterium]